MLPLADTYGSNVEGAATTKAAARPLATYLISGALGKGSSWDLRVRPAAPAPASGNLGTWKPGNLEIWGPGNLEIWRSGDLEIQILLVQKIKKEISKN